MTRAIPYLMLLGCTARSSAPTAHDAAASVIPTDAAAVDARLTIAQPDAQTMPAPIVVAPKVPAAPQPKHRVLGDFPANCDKNPLARDCQ